VEPSNPVVRRFVGAINAGDKPAFFALLTPTDDGMSLIVNYSNSTWGAMRTSWRFEVSGERIERFETGQA
jgi:hypothetical protein